MVQGMEELKNKPFTGHSGIVGEVKRDWQDSSVVLSYFSSRKKRGIMLYEQFVAEGIALGERSELTGGGLIRSPATKNLESEKVILSAGRLEDEISGSRGCQVFGGDDFCRQPIG